VVRKGYICTADLNRFRARYVRKILEEEREYYTKFAQALPKDTVILTAGCAKYRYNSLNLGTIGGIPRVLDAGQCNDCYSLVVIAQELAKAFGVGIK
jgi:hydroxylamine reductase